MEIPLRRNRAEFQRPPQGEFRARAARKSVDTTEKVQPAGFARWLFWVLRSGAPWRDLPEASVRFASNRVSFLMTYAGRNTRPYKSGVERRGSVHDAWQRVADWHRERPPPRSGSAVPPRSNRAAPSSCWRVCFEPG